MRRIFIFVIFILFLTGCSNIIRINEVTFKEKEELIILVQNIEAELKYGKTDLLEESLASNLRNNFVKEEIKNIDFSKFNIFNSTPIFSKNKANNIIGFNIQSTTLYYEVEYGFENGVWKIIGFKERRR